LLHDLFSIRGYISWHGQLPFQPPGADGLQTRLWPWISKLQDQRAKGLSQKKGAVFEISLATHVAELYVSVKFDAMRAQLQVARAKQAGSTRHGIRRGQQPTL